MDSVLGRRWEGAALALRVGWKGADEMIRRELESKAETGVFKK